MLLLAAIQGHPEVEEGNFVSDTSHLPFSIYCDKFLPPSSVLLIPLPTSQPNWGSSGTDYCHQFTFTLGPGVTPPGENSVLLQANSLGQRNECLMLDMLMAYGPA